jgi:outer membrane protein OmpA-like peptidoglycan-associated protein
MMRRKARRDAMKTPPLTVLLVSILVAGSVQARAQEAAATFQAYSKFDFVAGDKVVAFDDFMEDSIGDFPARWNTNAAGEVVTVANQPGRWLKLTGGGFFVPEYLPLLPDNFTLEFDVLTSPDFNSSFRLNTSIVELSNVKQPAGWQAADNRFTFTAQPGTPDSQTQMEPRQGGVGVAAVSADTKQFPKGSRLHVSVSRQRQRVRVYFNQDKVWDVARALQADAKYNTILFFVPRVDEGSEYYLANVRLAVGAPDTRNKLLTDGKWVTNGILFDVNSDRIRGESYGALREVANVLNENADLKIQIVGHTDADGDEAQNLDLSRRRAASVKSALVSEFKIDAARMDTDGRGETQSVDKNDTAAGKANNRRVEFIKK